MNNDLETILDTCLYQIEEGEASVEECLALYPDHAAQLEPRAQRVGEERARIDDRLALQRRRLRAVPGNRVRVRLGFARNGRLVLPAARDALVDDLDVLHRRHDGVRHRLAVKAHR